MPRMSPNDFKTTKKSGIRIHRPKIHDVYDNIVGREKTKKEKLPLIYNGLCPVGRRLSGGRVPLTVGEATPKLYQHLWKGTNRNCQLCTIPVGIPTNSEQGIVRKKLEDLLGLDKI